MGPALEAPGGPASEKKLGRSCRSGGSRSGSEGEFLGLGAVLGKTGERTRREKEGRTRNRSGGAMSSRRSRGGKGGRERDRLEPSGLVGPEGGVGSCERCHGRGDLGGGCE